MTRLEKIEKEVASLRDDEYRQFRSWFVERDWAEWGSQIEADSDAGKLDFLLAEAREQKQKGTLREL